MVEPQFPDVVEPIPVTRVSYIGRGGWVDLILTKLSRPPSLCHQCTPAVFLGSINTCCNRNGQGRRKEGGGGRKDGGGRMGGRRTGGKEVGAILQ